MQRLVTRTAAVLALAMVAGACGGGGGVGKDLDLKKGEGGSGAIRQASTTTVAVVTTVKTATTLKPTATTNVVPNAIYRIQDDAKGQYIDPLSHAVRAGSLVRFTNEDDTPHTITGKIGSTVVMGPSPSIAPGTSWDVRPMTKGTYDIIDEQRPYAAGVTLTVG
jgi:plastocyanin